VTLKGQDRDPNIFKIRSRVALLTATALREKTSMKQPARCLAVKSSASITAETQSVQETEQKSTARFGTTVVQMKLSTFCRMMTQLQELQ